MCICENTENNIHIVSAYFSYFFTCSLIIIGSSTTLVLYQTRFVPCEIFSVQTYETLSFVKGFFLIVSTLLFNNSNKRKGLLLGLNIKKPFAKGEFYYTNCRGTTTRLRVVPYFPAFIVPIW